MQMFVFRKTSLLILLCAALAGLKLYASPRWVKFTSAHFELLTSAGEKPGRNLLLLFEQMRSFFQASAFSSAKVPDPVRIVAFNSDLEFAPFRLNEATAAFFAGGSNGDYIVMKSASSEYRPTAIHEYVHLLIRHAGLPAPLWWQEGLAELYSTMQVVGSQVEIGAINARHYNLLKRQPLVDLPALMGADRYSDLYNRKDKAAMYYAESWALVHMLLLSAPYRPNADEFVKLQATGIDPSELFRKVYGKTLARVQEDLAAYLEQAIFNRQLVPTRFERLADLPAPIPATDLEVQVALANVLLGTDRAAQARQILDSLSRAYPGRWEIEEAFGYACWYAADRDQARIHFGRAVEKGMTNAKTYLDYVELLSETGAANSALISLLEKALKLQPESEPAGLKLASLYLSEGQYSRVLERIAGIKAIPPQDAFQTLCLKAYAHLGMGEIAQAKNIAEEARTHTRTVNEISDLERLFRALTTQLPTEVPLQPAYRIRPAPAAQIPLVNPAGTPPDVENGTKVQSPSAPKVRQIEGRLRRIDCLDTNLNLVIQAGGREWAFLILDPARITVKGRHGDKVLFYCGLQPGMPVVITYVPKPNTKFGTAGEMVMIEYL